MLRTEFESLSQAFTPSPVTVSAAELTEQIGQGDRTLLYGYDCDRNTWHVYVQGGEIHRLVTTYPHDVATSVIDYDHGESMPVEDLLPNKRAYPERTDFAFTTIARGLGFEPCFTTWDDPRAEQFAGQAFVSATHADLTV